MNPNNNKKIIDIHRLGTKLDRYKTRMITNNEFKLRREIIKQIEDYTQYLSATEGKDHPANILKHLQALRRLFENINKPYQDITREELLELVRKIKDGEIRTWGKENTQISKNTLNRDVKVWKVFDRYTMRLPPKANTDKIMWIQVKQEKPQENKNLPPFKQVYDERLVTNNLRDRALLGFMVEAGAEIGAILNMRIKDIDFTQKRAKYTLIPWKKGRRTRENIPIFFCRTDLMNWIKSHPSREDENSFLWVSKRRTTLDNGKETYKTITPRYVSKLTNKHSNLKPHDYRRVSMNYFCKFLNRKDFCIKYGLSFDSAVLNSYFDRDDNTIEESTAEYLGIDTIKPREKSKLQFAPACFFCGEDANDKDSKVCSKCGMSLDPAEALKKERETEEKLKTQEERLRQLEEAIRLIKIKS